MRMDERGDVMSDADGDLVSKGRNGLEGERAHASP